MKFWLGASFVPTDQFAELARAAERCGFDTLTLSDHLFYAEFGSKYPTPPPASRAGTPRRTGPTCG